MKQEDNAGVNKENEKEDEGTGPVDGKKQGNLSNMDPLRDKHSQNSQDMRVEDGLNNLQENDKDFDQAPQAHFTTWEDNNDDILRDDIINNFSKSDNL